MIAITLSRDFPRLDMLAGHEYLVEDCNAGQLMQDPGLVESIAQRSEPGFYPRAVDGRVLITRPGGIGDLLFLTPLIHYLSTECGMEVHVCACRDYWPVLEHNPHVHALHDYPMRAWEADDFHSHLWLENAVEGGGPANALHMADLFAHLAGVKFPKGFSRNCRVWVEGFSGAREINADWRKGKFAGQSIGLHVTASSPSRRYTRFNELLQLILSETDWDVHLYGAPGEITLTDETGRVYNHTEGGGLALGATLRHLSHLDGFIGVDSGLLHAAGGMGIPSVGLYAAFPGELRTKYHPSVTVIQARAACAPCYHHGRMTQFVPGAPCAVARRCVVLDSIHPMRIVDNLRQSLDSPPTQKTGTP